VTCGPVLLLPALMIDSPFMAKGLRKIS